MTDDLESSIDESRRRAFEADRRNGGARPIEDFLPSDGDPRWFATLEELILIDLEFSWKRFAAVGELQPNPTKIDNYVSRFPCLNRPDVLERLRSEEQRCRQQCGSSRAAEKRIGSDSNFDTEAETLVSAVKDTSTAPGPSAERIDRYELLAEHGRGGFARVWRANDPKLGRDVALKQLKREFAAHPDMRRRFVIEAQVAARLEHPGIVPVHDLGRIDSDNPYYTMKLVGGETLSSAIAKFHESPGNRFRTVEFRRLLDPFLAVCRTMEYAHSCGVIHRDLKPQNIVVGEYGETIILDWGLAKVLHDESAGNQTATVAVSDDALATMAGDVKGTPAFMSPEQAAGRVEEVDDLSDVYALGVILYQLLSGKLPFDGNSTAEVLKHVVSGTSKPLDVVNPHIPKPLQAICRKAMATDRGNRFATVSELRGDVERYLADEPVHSYREPLPARLVRWMRRRRTITATTAVSLTLLMLAGIAGLILKRRADQREFEQAVSLQAKDAEVERSDAEARRQEDLRIAGLRTSAEVAAAAALSDIRAGRFDAAHQRLQRVLEQIREEPKLVHERDTISLRSEQSRRLAGFYELSESAQRDAYFQRDAAAVQSCHDALKELQVFGHADWWNHLPTEDLTVEQVDQLQWEVYRALMLIGALTAKQTGPTNLLESANWLALRGKFLPEKQRQRFQTILTTGELIQGFRYSAGYDTLQRYAREFLGIKPRREITLSWRTRSPSDRLYLGMTLYYVSSFKEDVFVKAAMTLAQFRGLPLEQRIAEHRSLLKQAAEESPRHYWSQMMYGIAERDAGNLDTALAAYTRCIVLRPDYWVGYVERSDVYRKMANTKKPSSAEHSRLIELAQRDAEHARDLAPQEPQCQLAFGATLSFIPGRVVAALDAFHKAQDLTGPLTVTGSYRDITAMRSGLEATNKFLSTWRKDAPNEPAILLFWARTVLELKPAGAWSKTSSERQTCEAAIAMAMRFDPLNPYTWLVSAMQHEKGGKPDRALADFQRAAELDPGCYPAVWGVARSLASQNRHEDALAAFDRLSSIAVNDWQKTTAAIGRCIVLRALNRPDEAAAAFDRALAIDPRTDLRPFRLALKNNPTPAFPRTIPKSNAEAEVIVVQPVRMPAESRAALLNGGFELGFSGRYWIAAARNGDPSSWAINGPSLSSAVLAKDVRHAGSVSLHIRDRTQASKDTYGWTEQIVPLIPGAQYRITLWARGKNLQADSLFIAAAYPRRRDDRRIVPIRFPAGTYDWKRLSGTYRVPSGRRETAIRIVSTNRGEAWIDDIEITLESAK